jgi:hypothetical protein
MADASVTFVSETIQTENLDKTTTDPPWSFSGDAHHTPSGVKIEK